MQLLQTNMPVAKVCHAVGFESLSSFSGLFKKLVGLTPSSYLLQQQKIKVEILKTPLNFIPGCFAKKNGWRKEGDLKEDVQ
jgi:AraC-like DNA-binding protein